MLNNMDFSLQDFYFAKKPYTQMFKSYANSDYDDPQFVVLVVE